MENKDSDERPVAYLGYGRYGLCHGRHLTGAQQMLGKN